MDISKIIPGQNPPDDLNVIIEVPLGGDPIKYEIDKASGAMFIDRYLYTEMRYPCNYGFVPHTLSLDGDPIDVMVVGNRPLVPGSVVRARPVGVLMMTDDKGPDWTDPKTRSSRTCGGCHSQSTFPDLPSSNSIKGDLLCLRHSMASSASNVKALLIPPLR